MLAGNGLIYVPLRPANKPGTVEMLTADQPWIAYANSVWSGNEVRRFNQNFVRWPLWKRTAIDFEAVCTPLSYSTGNFLVYVNGAKVATVAGVGDGVPHPYHVDSLAVDTVNGSTIEVWEPWLNRAGAQNTSADGPHEGGYVTKMGLPPGMLPPAFGCSIGIIMLGDSIEGTLYGGGMHHSEGDGSLVNTVRANAHARGRLVVALGAGGTTVAGDGLTPQNRATLIHQAWVSMGSPATTYVFWQLGFNDFNDYGATASNNADAVRAHMQGTIDATALGATTYHVVATPLPALNESNHGGGTLGDHRAQQRLLTGVTTFLDGTSYGLNMSTMSVDGIHLGGALGPTAVALQYALVGPALGMT